MNAFVFSTHIVQVTVPPAADVVGLHIFESLMFGDCTINGSDVAQALTPPALSQPFHADSGTMSTEFRVAHTMFVMIVPSAVVAAAGRGPITAPSTIIASAAARVFTVSSS
jgi:hypothetical protein